MKNEFLEQELPLWEKMIKEIFENSEPHNKEWNDINQIVQILNMIGANDAHNHTFLPTGGGNDLHGCTISNEENCIEMNLDNIPTIVKPKRLVFTCYESSSYEWAFFYLEIEELKSSEVYNTNFEFEELVEVRPKEYVDRSIWDYNRDSLPKSARVVVRNFSGNFAIFSKASTYNRIGETYDARHSGMGYEGFREYVRPAAEN
ncbi:hypothetical protein [Carnobacterium sp.]|uniref:hypothetical protein n=1 Tax=Carnobacterium sp. TaxID=48221 RepID=UPI00388EBF43